MKISKAFNRDLPLALLFQAPTPEQLARFLETGSQGEAYPSLVAVQSSGSKRPLFCIHGGAGTTLYLRKLSQYLGPEQPVYGLESEGLDGRAITRTQVEEMATHYIAEMRKVQAEGPYQVAGYCFGGIVAFEMARQLAEAGQESAFVGLLNAPLRARVRRAGRVPQQRREKKTLAERLKAAWAWRVTAVREKLRWGSEAVMLGCFRAVGVAVPQSMRTRFVMRMTDQAENSYQPKVYGGCIRLFRGRGVCDHDPEMGWHGLATSGVEVHEIGDAQQNARHEMVNEPVVGELALAVTRCLERACEVARAV
jgi:aspartate racemase